MDNLAKDKRYVFDGLSDSLVKDVNHLIGLTETERDFGVEAAQAMLTGIQKTAQAMDEQPGEWFVSVSNRDLLVANAARLQDAISPRASS